MAGMSSKTQSSPGPDGAQTGAPLQVDVISDVMCPWCYIGKRRLEAAVAASPVPIELRWRPFQLDGTLPPEGKDRKTYLADKFGSADQARALYKNVEAAGEAESIPFEFDRISVSPNTLDAHRLIRWAGGIGAAMQDAVVESLFRAYFLDGQHIGDRAVLRDIAEQAGMDGELVAELLDKDADSDVVRQEIVQAGQMGVTGVPTFIVGNKYALVGAQPAEQLADAFTQIAAALAAEQSGDTSETASDPS